MSKKTLIYIFIAEGIIGATALLFIFIAFWNKPLGPVLGLSTQMPGQVEKTNKPTAASGENSTPVPEPTSTPASILSQIASLLNPPSISQPLCGGPSVMTILVIGSDERNEDYLYGLADSIRIVRIDFTIPKMTTLDIPRDLWVEIPDISDHYGITHGKLNQAYFFGNPGMGYYDGPGEGPGLLARTLVQNFDLSVDHYLAVDMKTFVRMVDTVGGIDIYLSSKIDLNENRDGANPDYVFEPGMNHLDGQMALKLAMNRYPTTFQRARYQDIVLSAIEDKILSPAMFPKLPELVSQFSQSVQTDLSPNDINKLLCIEQKLTKDDISMVAFPEDMFTSGHAYDPYRQVNTSILETDFTELRDYIARYMNGTWP